MATGLQVFVLVPVTVNAPPVRVSLVRVTRNRHSCQCECGLMQYTSLSLIVNVHVSMHFSLIHSIVTRVIRLAQNKAPMALAPALVETYSRLLVYIEIESLGIKGFISKHSV